MDLLPALALGIAIATLVALWRVASARRNAISERIDLPPHGSKPRFETTMNELRDLREALRPALQDAGQHRKSEPT